KYSFVQKFRCPEFIYFWPWATWATRLRCCMARFIAAAFRENVFSVKARLLIFFDYTISEWQNAFVNTLFASLIIKGDASIKI
ncbi:MAG: hypothetical protein DRQ99_25740, partial [Candidatus Parabeggiatoa sp. nov. 3]